ncbi:MAG TPA: TlpA disulfide reductase family protein [Opitutaceae bacterium]|nr:TlpA disulfide reductase family protein [Opitutaceae bacterium]
MKKSFRLLAGLALLVLACLRPVAAAETGAVTGQLAAIVEKINAKLSAGKDTEADLADELKAFDTLLAAHRGEKTEEVSQILALKASCYLTVFRDADKALVLIRQLKADFPDTPLGREADGMIAGLEKQAAQDRIQAGLTPGTAFPDFSEKDTEGHPLSIASYKGKVVLVDFWATWCPPCIDALPGLIRTYGEYHSKGFEIVGVSLDREGDGQKLAKFTKENAMPWPQFFDGGYWENKLAVKYGVNQTPTSYLLDKDGRIIGRNLHDEELGQAIAKALAAK